MAKLYVLSCGRSKSNLRPIMIDLKHKCENYQRARESSGMRKLHYSVELAPPDAKVWRKDTTNKWTNYNAEGPKVIRK